MTSWPMTEDPVAAHAGGIDEMIIVAVPIAAFLILQWLSRRKARQQAGEQTPPDEPNNQTKI